MKTYFADSFTNQKFKGNPAAVCFVENDLDNTLMQNIAMEIGFSETAFIKHITDNKFSIRFFTPKFEIPLCGHATLASAKIIFDSTILEEITFVNPENLELKIRKENNKIVMQFPVYDIEERTVSVDTLNALGIKTVNNIGFNQKTKIILIEINNSDDLANLKPDFSALVKSISDINGILVTAKSNSSDYDFHYRYFWPWNGTNEDPVTGGVQTFLTKYWAIKLNKNKLKAFQSSERTGSMETALVDDKVFIYGEAVVLFKGEFL